MHTYFDREVALSERRGIELFGLGAAYFDEPELRLAILGPPAITRLMFEMWLVNPWLIGRFDLRNPRQRRDYALWLKEEGGSFGLDQWSVAAAVAFARRGASLIRIPPPWPSQAGRTMTRRDASVGAWLTEPIAWDLGGQPDGIPMPRMLAPCGRRQDVRRTFQSTPADVLTYIAWCLTQACGPGAFRWAGCPAAGFLDMPDPNPKGRLCQ